MLKPDDGQILIKLARKSIETYLKTGKIIEIPSNIPSHLHEKRGVFVTLHKNRELRGCIGYPEPIKPLSISVIEVAIAAAAQDPRFPPVEVDELKEIDIEVTVLTPPELVEVEKPEYYVNEIIVGEDGLIVERGYYKGLLLPQVPLEWGWDAEEFLTHTCLKAGLNPDCWLLPDTKIFKFKGQIFSESD